MGEFKEFFNNWIYEKTYYQIDAIDKTCKDLEIYPSQWFSHFLNRDVGNYTGTEFLKEMLTDFVFYVSNQFSNRLLTYLPPEGYNIHNEPYLGLNLNLHYHLHDGFKVKKKNRKKFTKVCKKLTLTQKKELMKDKLFSFIVNQTKLKIYNKKEIRALKLKQLNEYSTNS